MLSWKKFRVLRTDERVMRQIRVLELEKSHARIRYIRPKVPRSHTLVYLCKDAIVGNGLRQRCFLLAHAARRDNPVCHNEPCSSVSSAFCIYRYSRCRLERDVLQLLPN